jgi:hypothetical protein
MSALSGPPTPESAGAADAADFDRLVSEILENPEALLDPALTPEQILEIQQRLNPYAGVAGPPPAPGRKKVAACSYTNLREDYLRRLLMTGLVGFLFQMYHEWEVPAEQRRWVPARKKADAAAAQPFEAGALVGRLEELLALAREMQAAAEGGAGEAARAAGLLYAVTHLAHRLGAEAEQRLRGTAEAGRQHAEVREVLRRHPLPPPAGQVEMPAAQAKELVGAFLRHWLEYDPSIHVRSGLDGAPSSKEQLRPAPPPRPAPPGVADEDPFLAAGPATLAAVCAPPPAPVPEHRAAVAVIRASPTAYNAVAALLRDEDLADAAVLAVREAPAFRRYLLPVPAASPARPAAEHVPPQDTFHRLAYYMEVNHEELRTVAEALYPERPDLDWALALWAVFEGAPAEVDAAFEKYCQRYQEEVPSSIRALEFGGWTLLADFKENRKRLQFYNKHTDVLRRILDRHAEDKRIGAELMRNRVRRTKARNIAEDGPDAPGLKEYRRGQAERGLDLAKKGAERVIGPEEMKRLEKARGDLRAARELELLEQTEKRIAELDELAALRRGAGRDLAEDERLELAHHRRELGRIRESLAVPDDAVQVDVFTTDAAAGGFSRSSFYTKAEAPEHLAPPEAAPGAPASEHPAVRASNAAAPNAGLQMPNAGLQTPNAAPQYAPYALQHMFGAPSGAEDGGMPSGAEDCERR